MYVAIKELSGHNGFLVEWRIYDGRDRFGVTTERQKFFPTKDEVVKGLPKILAEAV